MCVTLRSLVYRLTSPLADPTATNSLQLLKINKNLVIDFSYELAFRNCTVCVRVYLTLLQGQLTGLLCIMSFGPHPTCPPTSDTSRKDDELYLED